MARILFIFSCFLREILRFILRYHRNEKSQISFLCMILISELMVFSKVEPSYFSKDGCRIIWSGVDEDDVDTVVLNKEELDQLVEILKNNNVGKVELEDNFSEILINSDVVHIFLYTSYQI